MGARYYNPRLGVFYGPDPAPVDPTSAFTFNRYIYANQNPYGFTDPDGRAALFLILIAAPAVIETAIDVFGLLTSAAGCMTGDAGECLAMSASALDIASGPNPIGDIAQGVSVSQGRKQRTLSRIQKAASSGQCFVAGTLLHSVAGPVAIEDVQVGDRVWTAFGGDTPSDSKAWFRIKLRMSDDVERTSELVVTRLLSDDEFEALGAPVVGAAVPVAFTELEISGSALVLDVVPNVFVPYGPGRLVLATLSSLSNDVYEVSFVGGGESLRGTGGHPLYSLDRDDWVRVRDLQVGERLQTAEGAVTIAALEKVRGVLYNLEVEGDHEYLVGKAGVRAHNTGCGDGIIYIRTNKATGKEYVGQSTRGEFSNRQSSHHRDNPGQQYDFDVLEEIPQNQLSKRSLDVAEEDWIRAGGGPEKIRRKTRDRKMADERR